MRDDEDGALPPVLEKVSFTELVDRARAFVSNLLKYIKLYFVLLFILVILTALYYAETQPIYTATAVIGPPNPSPSASLLSSMGANVIGSSVARRVLGGSQVSAGDPFQEFQQLLSTPRLEVELAEKDRFLQRIYHTMWDSENGRWRPPSKISETMAVVKRALQRPAGLQPDILWLDRFLHGSLSIAQAESLATSPVASITSTGSGYFSVSLTFEDPGEAKTLLSDYLNRADTIIRKEQLSDVDARIQFINAELPKITQTEQRDALIQTLAAQEQLKIMLVADKRYCFVMISPPYVSPQPTAPAKPTKMLTYCLFFSLVLWGGLVALERKSPVLQRWLLFFKRREQVK